MRVLDSLSLDERAETGSGDSRVSFEKVLDDVHAS
jgi:hypothetical protein